MPLKQVHAKCFHTQQATGKIRGKKEDKKAVVGDEGSRRAEELLHGTKN